MTAPKKTQPQQTHSHSFDNRLRKQSIELYDEAMNLFEEIRSKNRIKIIKFLHNLVDCGNKTESAFKAGIGVSEDKNKPIEKQRSIAASEADRYLKNPQIKKAYEALQRSREMDLFSAQSFTKEKSIAMLAQIGVSAQHAAPAAAKGSITEAAKLSGHYEGVSLGDTGVVTNVNINYPVKSQEQDDEKKRLEGLGFIETSAEEDNAVTKSE